jgi:uncharacterized protein (TIGR02145 family)
MVQDMKFGSSCTKTTFSGSSGSDQTGKLSTAIGYTNLYGDCRSNVVTGAGYYYDWAAAIQKSGAYYGGTLVGCSGTSSGALCQGICPANWHLPTLEEFELANTLTSAAYACSPISCWLANDVWSGIVEGWLEPAGTLRYASHLLLWTSTPLSQTLANAWVVTENTATITRLHYRSYGTPVRCMRN